VDPERPRSTPVLARFQAQLQVAPAERHRNRERLRDLNAAHGDEVQMFCTHDPVDLDRLR